MTSSNGTDGAVLIIDPDDSIREMIAAVLRRAGFTADCAAPGDLRKSQIDAGFDVIVRDVNLAPAARERSLQELACSAAQLLRRTVILTTSPAALQKHRGIPAPFAVLPKPFDVHVLVETVRECYERNGRIRGDGGSARKGGDDESAGGVSLTGLRRFVGSIPTLRTLLSDEASSVPELLLRSELRRTALRLAHMLGEVSAGERDRSRAVMLRAAARVASEIAGAPPRRFETASREH